MHCPTCGQYTETNETRITYRFVVRRRRICANGHRFTTYEIPSGVFTSLINEIRVVLPLVVTDAARLKVAAKRGRNLK